MLSRKMSNHRTKERSTEAQHHLALSRAGCPFPAGSARWRLACCGAGTWRWAACADGPWREAAVLPRPPSFGAPAASSCFLLPLGVGMGPREVLPAPFCKSTGPWLYGDSEACTEYVQNDFFTSKVERHPFDKGPFGEGYRRKLRVPFVPKATAGSWHRA